MRLVQSPKKLGTEQHTTDKSELIWPYSVFLCDTPPCPNIYTYKIWRHCALRQWSPAPDKVVLEEAEEEEFGVKQYVSLRWRET